MKRIKIKKLDQDVYYEKLSNGLRVYLIPYENKNNYFASLFTNYGSINNDFIPVGEQEITSFPAGIAHFLEHKMFEMKDDNDPFTYYAKTGTHANASTSFKITRYIIWGNSKVSDNINYLLKYVFEPYFTDSNVEKEKGIIVEEINMYNDLPEWVLNDKLMENLFVNHPIRIPIAGNQNSVMQITKEALYKCYNTFYQPSNMCLVISGNFDKDEIIKVIKDNLNKRKFPKVKIVNKDYQEPKEVFKKYEKVLMNIEIPKLAYAIKIDLKDINMSLIYRDLYFEMFNVILFGNASLFKEDIRKNDLAISFYTSSTDIAQYKTLEFFAKTKDPEKFIARVCQELDNINITLEDFERIKKVWLASEVSIIDNHEMTLENISDDIQKYGDIILNRIDIIKSLKKSVLDEMIKKMDLTKRTTVIIAKEGK